MRLSLFDDDLPRSDMAPKSYSEPEFSYVNRSAREPAVAIRGALEEWFSLLPESELETFKTRMESETDSALLELTVHELLTRQGFMIEIHPQVGTRNKKPDFRATLEELSMIVEAKVVTDTSKEEEGKANLLNSVMDALNSIENPNFMFSLSIEGEPLKQPSLWKIKRWIAKTLKPLSPEVVMGYYEENGFGDRFKFEMEIDGLLIGIRPIPVHPDARGKKGRRAVGTSIGEAKFVQTDRSISTALREKASRYGVLEDPFLVVLNIIGDAFPSLDDAELGIFGQELEDTIPCEGKLFGRSGALLEGSGPTNRQVSGILVVFRMNAWNLPSVDSHLFFNPWAVRPLPLDLFAGIPRTYFTENVRIRKVGRSFGSLLGLPEEWPGVR